MLIQAWDCKTLWTRILKSSTVVLFLVILCITVKLQRAGNRKYLLEFEYTMDNISEIVHSIETTGNSIAAPVNDITQRYKVLKNPATILCKIKPCYSFQMLLIVKSFIGNFAQRIAIRQTWSGQTQLDFKTVFVLGVLDEMEELVKAESNYHKDILQFDLIDSYENLVYKTIFTMIWVSQLHTQIHHVHFIDDDRIVNTKTLYRLAINSITDSDLKMIGCKLSYMVPFRDRTSKYYVSKDQYPFDMYPPYLIGGTILTNLKVVKKMSKSFPYIEIIPMEDVYIGIVSRLLNVEIIDNSGFLSNFQLPAKLGKHISSPGFNSYNKQVYGWKQLSKYNS